MATANKKTKRTPKKSPGTYSYVLGENCDYFSNDMNKSIVIIDKVNRDYRIVQEMNKEKADELIKKYIKSGNDIASYIDLIAVLECKPDVTKTGKVEKPETLNEASEKLKEQKKIEIPKELLKKYEEDFRNKPNVKNFFTRLLFNPNKESINSLYPYLLRHEIEITKDGYLLLYRNVYEHEDSSSLITAMSKEKAKRAGKAVYTDAHTRTFKIILGQPVKMEREDCDHNPNSECSRGLHVGDKNFSRKSFGDITIATLVCPSNIVSVPANDSYKMRTCEYFPLQVVKKTDLDPEQINDSEYTDFINRGESNSLYPINYKDQIQNLKKRIHDALRVRDRKKSK